MHPLTRTFIRLTLIIALGVVGLIALAFVLKIVVFAGIIAALVIGGLFLYNFIRRRVSLPVARP